MRPAAPGTGLESRQQINPGLRINNEDIARFYTPDAQARDGPVGRCAHENLAGLGCTA